MLNIIKYIKKKLYPDNQENDMTIEEVLRIEGIDTIEDSETDTKKETTVKDKGLKVIKTARGIDAINNAIEEGYTPLVQEVKPNREIYATDMLLRDRETGMYESVEYNYSNVVYATENNFEVVIETRYYPYSFPPFAAYCLPRDLKEGERVVLEDLIEDIVATDYNHSSLRLDSCEAIWDGKEFVIDEDSYSVDVGFD